MRKDILANIQTRYSYSDRQIILLNHGIDILISDSINMTVLLGISALAGAVRTSGLSALFRNNVQSYTKPDQKNT